MAAPNTGGIRAKPVCTSEAAVDIGLYTRYGAALNLQNVKWLITSQHSREILFGRPILETPGLNTPEFIASAADQFAGREDVDKLVGSFTELEDRRLARVVEGVFQTNGDELLKEDIENTDEWCSIAIETSEERKDIDFEAH